MFSTKNGRITVYETSNGFYITDSITKETKGMGDGVDMFLDKENKSLIVGSKEFYTALRKEVRENKATLLEAYFGIVK